MLTFLLSFLSIIPHLDIYHDCSSWCNYLHSVEYLGLVDEDFQNEYQEKSDIPLRQSKWTVGVRGLKFR